MMLIQRFTSLFCFILLVLKGVGAEVTSCEEALTDLFQATSERWHRFNSRYAFPDLDFYFIPDLDLIFNLTSMLYPKYKRPSNAVPKGAGFSFKLPNFLKKKQTEVFIDNPIGISTKERDWNFFEMIGKKQRNWDSVKFTVRYPDGRQGMAIFLCRGKRCNEDLFILQGSTSGSNKLSCLERINVDDFVIEAKEDFSEIVVTVFGYEYPIFAADLVVNRLVGNLDMTKITDIGFDPNIIVFRDKDGTWVGDFHVPSHLSGEVREHIQAAIDIVMIYRAGRMSSTKQKPSEEAKVFYRGINKRQGLTH